MSSTAAAPLFSPAFVQNPYPTYHHHLTGAAVQLLDPERGYFGVFRYAQCARMFREPRLSSQRPPSTIVHARAEEMPQFEGLIAHMRRWLLLRDPPSHGIIRRALNKGFSPAVMEGLRPRIEAIVARLLDRIEERGAADIVTDLAYPLPVTVICDLLGVPEAEHERCVELTNRIAVWFASVLRSPETARPAQQAIFELVEIFKDLIARRTDRSRGDLLDLLLELADRESELTSEELHAQCVMLLFGGHETTRHWIGNSVHTFLEHPEVLAELRADPELVRPAMEEVLRFESPVQMFGRAVAAPIDIDGTLLPKASTLLLVVAAAQRDCEQFPEPDRFDARRPHLRHFAFGGDAHVCLGSALARLEGQIALRELIRRFPRLAATSVKPRWSSLVGFRGLESLPVTL